MGEEARATEPGVRVLRQLWKLLWLSLLLTQGLVFGASRQRADIETAAATLIRWPYLQQVTSDSARIIWTTNVKGSPQLAYVLGGSYPLWTGITSRSVSTPAGDYYEHKAVLTGLQQHTWYYYQIFDAGVNLTPSGKRWFRTAHANGPFTFVAFGDSGTGSPEQYQVRDRMSEHQFDIILHTGDLAYQEGSYEQFESFHFAVYRELLSQRPFFPTIGNHEYLTDNGQPYLDVFDLPITAGWDWDSRDLERYYSFDWGYAHFVSLDSEGPLYRISDSSDNDMADWLEADLAADDHTWRIATVHRPVYSSSPRHPETDVREKLAPIFEAYGVDLVLSGHNHTYERTYPIRDGAISTLEEGGVVYVVTGGGGNILYPVPGDWFTAACAKVHHFVKVRVTKCALILTVIDKDGNVIDQAILDKCPCHTYMPVVAQD
jgi:predicted phosphodiesterase